MTKGQIVKALAGYYFVKTCEGVYMCRARGIFKKNNITPLVGDFVNITIQDEEEGVIEEILPRKNAFVRPPVANVDMFIVTVSVVSPEINTEIIDKFLVSAEAANAEAVLCINKVDLSASEAKRIEKIYKKIYNVVLVSALTGEGEDELIEICKGKNVAFAGASGVGKTSLLGRITKLDNLETGDVSRKTGRGKHTTRLVEIFETSDGTKIYDTPGFTSFDVIEIGDERLDRFFPEFKKYLGKCRFDNCAHEVEPDCAIIEAVEKGEIGKTRYRSYLTLLEIIRTGIKKKRPEFVKGRKSG